ncbi:MAG: 30S ribosomal protein S6 [Candidatus Roizmanbacteria bacterium GW2011_GWA2_37_7]|uniref:Small ribosomal subunit protein bS6 n=1 Tax=Candidatus Roizmanbacteria bacterium GW2011_GWA2_37_7 TaxID=1618481 RepID=A0A0G0JK97_9BACT|nr:MAG: 30S ribosomal protein S6 [Candidatus Roizmanbacteria bacterium GW2011_GWA2_37_7]
MSTFEFTFLVDDQKSIKAVEDILALYKGKKVTEESLGKRLLEYPIDKKTSAEYFVWQIELDKASVKEFKQKLNFDKVVMRYLLLQKNLKKTLKKAK